MAEMDTVSLARAAHALGLSYIQAYRLLMLGRLRGEQDARGRWRVRRDDVERERQARSDGPAAA